MESFETSFREFLSHVGINSVEPVNANVVELDDKTTRNPFGYRYVDRMEPRSLDKINHLFELDFELFNYERILP